MAVRILLRAASVSLVLAALAGCSGSPASAPASSLASSSAAPGLAAPVDRSAEVAPGLQALERELDVRIGVSAIDTGSGDTARFRADERFLYASTIKVFAVAEFLRQVPAPEREEVRTWTEEQVDAAGYSPVTEAHIDGGLTLAELAEAAVRQSDNTALNLVLDRIGGPAGFGSGLRDLGDSATVVVDNEPSLNRLPPNGLDNTTTPDAFTAGLARLVDSDHLASTDRALLVEWMSGNATGDLLIRAGAPDGWTIADKSGGAGPVRNDIALVTRPNGEPVVLSVLTQRNDAESDYDHAAVSRAAKIVLDAFRNKE